MGQFGNQPDFATNSIKEITTANGFISDTPSSASFLGGSIIYIGDNLTVGNNLKVIPAGVAGPFAISKFSSTNNGGQDYSPGANTFATTTTGSGTGLTVDVVVANTALANILTIAVNTAGTGYENGDFIEVVEGGQGGVNQARYRVQVSAGLPTATQAVIFKGLGTGGFLPVTVDYVLATGTTVAELIAAK
jgi:hypothetical protein